MEAPLQRGFKMSTRITFKATDPIEDFRTTLSQRFGGDIQVSRQGGKIVGVEIDPDRLTKADLDFIDEQISTFSGLVRET